MARSSNWRERPPYKRGVAGSIPAAPTFSEKIHNSLSINELRGGGPAPVVSPSK